MTIWDRTYLDSCDLLYIYQFLTSAKICMKTLTELPGEFLLFYTNWVNSEVYKIPSGYIRISFSNNEAFVHGVFFRSPFKDSIFIKNMLYLWLRGHKMYNKLSCTLPKKFKGAHKLLRHLGIPPCEITDKNIIYTIRRP